MRAMFYEYPQHPAAAAVDDQWLVKDTLVVKPVVHEHTQQMQVYLPPNDVAQQVRACSRLANLRYVSFVTIDGHVTLTMIQQTARWFDFHTLAPIDTRQSEGFLHQLTDITLSTVPVYLRAGRVLPRKLRVRRAASRMVHDPYTLVVAPDRQLHAAASEETERVVAEGQVGSLSPPACVDCLCSWHYGACMCSRLSLCIDCVEAIECDCLFRLSWFKSICLRTIISPLLCILCRMNTYC